MPMLQDNQAEEGVKEEGIEPDQIGRKGATQWCSEGVASPLARAWMLMESVRRLSKYTITTQTLLKFEMSTISIRCEAAGFQIGFRSAPQQSS